MKLTYSIAVEIDGTEKSFSELADSERNRLLTAAAQRGSMAISAECTQHPHEFVRL